MDKLAAAKAIFAAMLTFVTPVGVIVLFAYAYRDGWVDLLISIVLGVFAFVILFSAYYDKYKRSK